MFSSIIILAGGIGERLYPVSTGEHPKQFIEAANGKSFFQMALERALFLEPSDYIFIVTQQKFSGLAAEQCRQYIAALETAAQRFLEAALIIIGEPEPKHTAAAVQCCTSYLKAVSKASVAATLLVLTSDHIISPLENFLSNCAEAACAAHTGKFVLFAIKPQWPSTEFGYIQVENCPQAPLEGSVLSIVSFHEKPNQSTAEEYIRQKVYYWNSGMFAFSTATFEQELRRYTPAAFAAFDGLSASRPVLSTEQGIRVVANWNGLSLAYQKTPAIAIDKAIAEHTTVAQCVLATFEWTDAGTWDSFADIAQETSATAVKIESSNCFVYSDMPVALCGVEGLIVAIHKGKAVILKKGASHLIREAAAALRDL
ncbi:mannose-1-phosphate guanylyltransferase/mannose-6-phosphate isomerase [Spirochaetia bacterium]|nr:mannose-1-phosphate guanylyltransferase/mannose-6-phosphate isomerase [Spirochaetia bacterium]